ncbi:MAG: hypothetical protein AB7D06_08745 [Pedobacter sp.]
MKHVRAYFKPFVDAFNRLADAGDEEFEAMATELALAGCPFKQLTIGQVMALMEHGSLKYWISTKGGQDDRFRFGSEIIGAPQGKESVEQTDVDPDEFTPAFNCP